MFSRISSPGLETSLLTFRDYDIFTRYVRVVRKKGKVLGLVFSAHFGENLNCVFKTCF